MFIWRRWLCIVSPVGMGTKPPPVALSGNYGPARADQEARNNAIVGLQTRMRGCDGKSVALGDSIPYRRFRSAFQS